jgi:hypothetical protein
MSEPLSTYYPPSRLDEFNSARGLYEPQLQPYPEDYDDTSDLIEYAPEDNVRTCPACRGRCYEDDFDSIPCEMCNGDGVVPN